MIGYRVGDQFFFNKYLALYQTSKNNKPVQFICKDDEYDQLNWTKEPEQSFEDLMSSHALDLRNRHERLILGWSGGTDSHTIYNIFKKNNIHIDEIIVKTSSNIKYQPTYHSTWIRKNHYDVSTVITEYDQYDNFLRTLDRPNEEWIWKNSGDIKHSGVNTNGAHTKYLIEKNHGGKNYVYVTGVEKPSLIYKNKSWWTRLKDEAIYNSLGYDYNIEYFFLNPLLQLKQSHLLKNGVKEHMKKYNLSINDKEESYKHEADWLFQAYESPIGYRNFSRALGRVDELTEGVSFLQKLALRESLDLDLKQEKNYRILKGSRDPSLNAALSAENKASLNYVKGLFNLYTERNFAHFLRDNRYVRSPNKLLQINPIFSKSYNLGP